MREGRSVGGVEHDEPGSGLLPGLVGASLRSLRRRVDTT